MLFNINEMSLLCESFKKIVLQHKELFYQVLNQYKENIFENNLQGQFIIFIVYNLFGLIDKELNVYLEINEKIDFLKQFESKLFTKEI